MHLRFRIPLANRSVMLSVVIHRIIQSRVLFTGMSVASFIQIHRITFNRIQYLDRSFTLSSSKFIFVTPHRYKIFLPWTVSFEVAMNHAFSDLMKSLQSAVLANSRTSSYSRFTLLNLLRLAGGGSTGSSFSSNYYSYGHILCYSAGVRK